MNLSAGVTVSSVVASLRLLDEPHTALVGLTAKFDRHKIVYAIAGSAALWVYNVKRAVQDIDIWLARESWDRFWNIMLMDPSCGIRDTKANTLRFVYNPWDGLRCWPLEVLMEGDGIGYPGYSIGYSSARQRVGGVWYITLPKLLEMKLRQHRPKDVADLKGLIQNNDLSWGYMRFRHSRREVALLYEAFYKRYILK